MNHPSLICGSLLCLAAFALAEEKPKYTSGLDYIQKTGKLFGISEARLNADGTVVLVDAKTTGYGCHMMMMTPDLRASDQTILNPSESCRLVERHSSMVYLFKAADHGLISIDATETLDTRSFGGELKKQTTTFTLKPYSEETKPQADIKPQPEAGK